jgi:GrpB-like predicted nucleotidyltransferase (UPF0157 family)
MITILPYQSKWPAEFLTLGSDLRRSIKSRALRIDHIGSTSVPGLAAKDIIDIQVTVQDLDPKLEKVLVRAGYQRLIDITRDHLPPGGDPHPLEWSKWMFKPSAPGRPVNLHVRVAGRANQRYPLLFRDYLRSHPLAAEAYGRVKSALALHHPDNLDAYYDIKDPVCDLIVASAEEWAGFTGWEPGPSDC